MNLEQNPNNQAELDSKKQQLKDLETKEKELLKLLPVEKQISILEREIKNLESKSNKNHMEEALLTSKKQQLAELLSKQNGSTNKPSDKTALYIGGGIFIVLTLLLTLVLARNRRKKKLRH